MNEENLFKILKASIYGGELNLSGDCDYESIFSELQSQTVLTLTKPVLNQLPLSEDLREKWEKAINQQLAVNAKVAFAERKLCALLEAEGIEFAIVKGSAAAQYYPKPELRTRGDIDVLVLKEKYRDAILTLQRNGYSEKKTIDFEERHIELFKNNVECEIHQRFSEINDELIQNEIKKIKTNTHLFDNSLNGLVLLKHIQRHFNIGLGLRQYIDWCMFATAVCDDEFWNEELRPLADEFGLTKFAKALTQLGINKGLIEKQYSWCSDVSNELCEELLHYFLYCGNFNRKHSAVNTKALRVMREASGIKGFKDYLEDLGSSYSKSEDKLSVYSTGVKYLFKHAKSYMNVNSINAFRQQKLEAERRKKLFKELGI